MDEDGRRFEPGETVAVRAILRGEVWFAEPTICVRDDGDLLALYTPPGARFGYPERGRFPAGRHPWQLAGKTQWRGHGKLQLLWAGVAHSVYVFWSGEQREFAGWYFNLQDAPRRTAIGVDTLDHELDIWWPAGAPSWQWKDVEEFAVTGELRYPGRVAEIQAEGDRVAAALDAGRRWWDESWARWSPDPSWTAPELPPGWADLPPT